MKQQTQTAAAESGMTAKKTQHQKIVAMAVSYTHLRAHETS